MTESTVQTAWPPSAAPPLQQGQIRTHPADFIVRETLSFELTGEGCHHYLLLRENGANTEWVARQLARFADIPSKSVGYAGRKDRQAITDQWFSVELPALSTLDWATLDLPGVELLKHQRHGRKLRLGAIKHNHFRLVIRHITGDWQLLATRIEAIKQSGLPNYFGAQRFGHNGQNLQRAEALFEGKIRLKKRDIGLHYSAARSALFNDLLALRIKDGSWCKALPGDVLMLNGSHSHFPIDQPDTETQQRIDDLDLHPTGPLHGRGESPAKLDCLTLEEQAMTTRPILKAGLEQARLDPDRRALRVLPDHLCWQRDEDTLTLAFSLPSGSYATALLAELIDNVQQANHFTQGETP